MPVIEFGGFVGPAYEARSKYQDGQRCINWYPEIDATPGAKSVMALYPSQGLEEFIDIPTLASISAAQVRCLYSPQARPELLIAVVGAKLCVLTPSGASFAVTAHDIMSSTGPVVAADNGTTIVLVDGTYGYTVTIATGAFAQITDVAWLGANRVNYLDGYFVFNKPDSQMFYWSENMAITFDALDFASKEAQPDNLVVTWVEHRELWLLGKYSTEVWFSSGTTDIFEKNDGVFIQHGCAAVHSVSRLGESFALLGTDERGAVGAYLAEGYNFRKISTQALDYAWSRYEKTDNAIAFTFRVSGHEFYQLTFPTDNKTWVFDISTGLWHERAYVDANGNFLRHRANCFANYRGRVLVGDYRNGLVYEYKDDVYTDNGDAIVRVRRCPHIIADRKNVRFNGVQIEFEPGVGLSTGQGSDPQAMLTWSDDGGSTWKGELWSTIGAVGKYTNRCNFHRLGMGRDRVFEVRVSDPVKAPIIGATLDFDPQET